MPTYVSSMMPTRSHWPARLLLATLMILAATSLSARDAGADWRKVETKERRIGVTAPGLDDKKLRIVDMVNDHSNGKGQNLCWNYPLSAGASACLTHQRILRIPIEFTYLGATNVAAMAGPLKSLRKDINPDVKTYRSPLGDIKVARFEGVSGDTLKDCFALSRYWPGNRERLMGWYCAASGTTLDDQAIQDILSTVRIRR